MSSSRRPLLLIDTVPFTRLSRRGSGSPARWRDAVPFTTRTDSSASLTPAPSPSAASPGPPRLGMVIVGLADTGSVSSGYPSQDPFSPCLIVACTPSRCAATTILNCSSEAIGRKLSFTLATSTMERSASAGPMTSGPTSRNEPAPSRPAGHNPLQRPIRIGRFAAWDTVADIHGRAWLTKCLPR